MIEISVPTLLIDEEKARRNIRQMMAKTQTISVSLRPHFKTHQSLEIGQWFSDIGIKQITVSSVQMAEKFIADGWSDVLIAFPLNLLELPVVHSLAMKASLSVMVEEELVVKALNKAIDNPVSVFIKVDTGYGRTGISWQDIDRILSLIELINSYEKLSCRGLVIHAGHSYKNAQSIHAILKESIERIAYLRNHILAQYPSMLISYGDTPSCSIGSEFPGIDEFRPGNFVFYDLVQHHLGACEYDEIAVAMACPVVAIHPDRRQVVIYGGAVHFSKDSMTINGQTVYGQMVELSGSGWGKPVHQAWLVSLSQEHGILQMPAAYNLDQIKIGQILYFLPVHSCLTADKMGAYYSIQRDSLITI